MITSPTNKDSKSITKTISKATMMFSSNGSNIQKSFRNAVLEGNEEKAIQIVTSKEGAKIIPSQPLLFSKKPDPLQDTPLHLAAKFGLIRLFQLLLQHNGNPSFANLRQENAAHSVCLNTTLPQHRAEILELILSWHKLSAAKEPIDVHAVDLDGNSSLHLAAYSGLLSCIDTLLKHGASMGALNKKGNTPVNMADCGQFANIGTMLELAWLFESSRNSIETDLILHNNIGTVYSVDNRSLKLSDLVDFMNYAVKMTSHILDETAARSEVLLDMYGWDVKKLKNEYSNNMMQVLKAAKLRPRKNSPKLANKVDEVNNVLNIGINIADVYLDPAYKLIQTFSILRDGEKQYHFQTIDNKVGVYPIDFDPTLRYMDEDYLNISPTSRNKPRKTELCKLCNNMMYEKTSIVNFISGNIGEPYRREIYCSSGHKFCFQCWSNNALSHFNDGHIPCPSPECGEILDLQWAPIVLRKSDSINRLLLARQNNVIKSMKLRWCSIEKCGLLVRIPANQNYCDFDQNNNSQFCFSLESSSLDHNLGNQPTQVPMNSKRMYQTPRVALCDNGHMFCLSCCKEAHAPCSCSEYHAWLDLTKTDNDSKSKEKISTSPTNRQSLSDKDKRQIGTLFVVPAITKKCPSCEQFIKKTEGSSIVMCEGCARILCWMCLQEWSMHEKNYDASKAYCNYFDEEIQLLTIKSSDNQHDESAGQNEEKDLEKENEYQAERRKSNGEVDLIRKQKVLRARRIRHHFLRYCFHSQALQVEIEVQNRTISRVSDGLRSIQEEENGMIWLHAQSIDDPVLQKSRTVSSQRFSGMHGFNHSRPGNPLKVSLGFPVEGEDEIPEDTDNLIYDYLLPFDENVDFLIYGFHELIKARNFCQWLYPFSLFEFDQKFIKGKKMKATHHIVSLQEDFYELQGKLEYFVELLSDLIARSRCRGSKNEITTLTNNLRQLRLYFEGKLDKFCRLPTAAEEEAIKQQFVAMNDQNALGDPPIKTDINNITPFNNALISNSDIKRKVGNVMAVSNEEAVKKSPFHAGGNMPQNSSQGIATTAINSQTEIVPKETQRLYQNKRISDDQHTINDNLCMLVDSHDKEVLLAKQVEQYGVNMYDSLNQQNESQISTYLEAGYSEDEAILLIFGEKFGWVSISPEDRVSLAPMVQLSFEEQLELDRLLMQGYSQQAAINFILSRRITATPSPSQMPLSMEDEIAIQRLMNLGYSFDQAMRMHFEVGGLQYQPMPSYNVKDVKAINVDNRIYQYMTQGYSKEQAIYMVNQDELNLGSGNFNGEQFDQRPNQPNYGSRTYDLNEQRSIGSQSISDFESITHGPEHPDYQSTVFRAGTHLNSAKPTNLSSSGLQSNTGYVPYTTAYVPNGYLAENSEAMTIERNRLIQQQELEFGINMYDAITPLDEAEIQQLMLQGCTYDDAVKFIFDQRYVFHRSNNGSAGQNLSIDNFRTGAVATNGYSSQSSHNPVVPPSNSNASINPGTNSDANYDDNRSYYSQGSEKKKKISRSSTVRAGRHQPNVSSNYSINSVGNSSSFSLSATQPASGSSRRPSNQPTAPSKEVPQHSQGSGFSGLGNKIKLKTADLKQLERMGFTRDQAIQALIQNDNNVHHAANALLSTSSR